MAKKGGLGSLLGESLGLTLPEDVVASASKKKDGNGLLSGIVGEIMGEVIVPEIRDGAKQGVADFLDDIFHKSPAPEPRKKEPKKEAVPVAQVTSGHAQNERLLGSGQNQQDTADVPRYRGNKWVNTASVILGGGVRATVDAVKFAKRVGSAAQESHRRSVEQKQAKAREDANIIDGEVKE